MLHFKGISKAFQRNENRTRLLGSMCFFRKFDPGLNPLVRKPHACESSRNSLPCRRCLEDAFTHKVKSSHGIPGLEIVPSSSTGSTAPASQVVVNSTRGCPWILQEIRIVAASHSLTQKCRVSSLKCQHVFLKEQKGKVGLESFECSKIQPQPAIP